MANTIVKAKKYVPILDEKYMAEVSTAILDSTEEAKYLVEANTFLVADRELAPLAKYNRNTGYVQGDVNLDWTPYVVEYDRGRMFVVDERDNEEAAGLAYLGIAGQFIKEYVAPELNAVRIATYATKAAAANKVDVTITDSASAYSAVRACANKLANDGVPAERRVTFIDVTTKGLIDDMDSYKSKAALADLGTVIVVPDNSFATTCTLVDAGGYTLGGKYIRFITIDKAAVIQHLTHVAPKIVTPEMNQDMDAYKYGYRIVGIADVYKNKKNGIYVGQGSAVPVTEG